MAFEVDKTGAENCQAGFAAGEDLSGHTGKAVRLTGTGVRAAYTAIDSGPVYVLANAPSSGQPAIIYGGPNIVEAKAGAAVLLGDYVTVSTSAFFTTTASWTFAVGTVRSAVASGSTFGLRLFF